MKREELIAQLEGAKTLSSQVDIDKVIELLGQIEPEVRVEKVVGMSPELADKLFEKIERALDYNSDDLVDKDSAEFSLSYDSRIELDRVDIDVRGVMEHVDAVFEDFIIPPVLEAEEVKEEDEATDEAEKEVVEDMTFAREEDATLNEAWSFPRGEDDDTV
jgi:hypothetical protein